MLVLLSVQPDFAKFCRSGTERGGMLTKNIMPVFGYRRVFSSNGQVKEHGFQRQEETISQWSCAIALRCELKFGGHAAPPRSWKSSSSSHPASAKMSAVRSIAPNAFRPSHFPVVSFFACVLGEFGKEQRLNLPAANMHQVPASFFALLVSVS